LTSIVVVSYRLISIELYTPEGFQGRNPDLQAEKPFKNCNNTNYMPWERILNNSLFYPGEGQHYGSTLSLST
jgi:hypothetical protein